MVAVINALAFAKGKMVIWRISVDMNVRHTLVCF